MKMILTPNQVEFILCSLMQSVHARVGHSNYMEMRDMLQKVNKFFGCDAEGAIKKLSQGVTDEQKAEDRD